MSSDRETIIASPCRWGPSATPESAKDACERCKTEVWTDIYSQQLRKVGRGLVCVPCAMTVVARINADEVHKAYPSWVGWERHLRRN